MPDCILQAHHLKKTYTQRTGALGLAGHQIHALDDVSLQLKRGTTLAIVGESGSGKSTLARGILRLLPLDSGEVIFDGKNFLALDKSALRSARRDIQMIFQDPFASLNPRMRVGDIIGEGLVIHSIGDARQRQNMVIQILEKVGLHADDTQKYPHQFSGGQRQRIGIARALILQPKLVICDEPVSALDVSVQAQILLLLKQLQQEMGLSYLFITHDLRVVRHIADEVLVMQKGKVIEQGSVESIYNAPQQNYTRQLLNAIPGQARRAATA
ncbi:peptide/nickel transport system ATP-binding protein/oligopeptide transport system ATP-binding protein [Methylophilus rhizosphaerae]|uniref:Peptide/nickel transport system ATP-binding protein/oligopeptide transport system ATP-binding protein n=1 Tax=Methylophilus rhizosphaerae TaxID=492660 RepID=A0A1G9B1V2_9PROT|nr:ATP-binding cassette domain-containing protein [Methylophilus rhizosphaerae]SDK33576.1 peptide/nickel transport system ATP-binding protein/oligopeptide transport system ATP-binding protein [Methylophilus rhizosphaerae]